MTAMKHTVDDARRWMFHREELPPRGTRTLTVADRERLFGFVCGHVAAQDQAADDGEAELDDIIEALAVALELDPETTLALYKAATS